MLSPSNHRSSPLHPLPASARTLRRLHRGPDPCGIAASSGSLWGARPHIRGKLGASKRAAGREQNPTARWTLRPLGWGWGGGGGGSAEGVWADGRGVARGAGLARPMRARVSISISPLSQWQSAAHSSHTHLANPRSGHVACPPRRPSCGGCHIYPSRGPRSHSVERWLLWHWPARELSSSPLARGSPQCHALFAATFFTSWLSSGRGPWAALCSGCSSPQDAPLGRALHSRSHRSAVLLTRSFPLSALRRLALLTQSPLRPRSASRLAHLGARSPQRAFRSDAHLSAAVPRSGRAPPRPRSPQCTRSPHRERRSGRAPHAALTSVPPSSWPRSPQAVWARSALGAVRLAARGLAVAA